MHYLLLLAALSLVAAGILWLRAGVRDRALVDGELRALQARLLDVEKRVQRQAEDELVLAHVIMEHGLADEEDLLEIRRRVIEVPLREANEHEEMLRLSGLAVEDERLVGGDERGNGSLH